MCHLYNPRVTLVEKASRQKRTKVISPQGGLSIQRERERESKVNHNIIIV